MARSRLDAVALTFLSESEALHDTFLHMRSDTACAECHSAALGEALLTAWLQTKWADFTRELLIASALGTRRTTGAAVQRLAGIKSRDDAERVLKEATARCQAARGLGTPVWHAPWFVLQVSEVIALNNLTRLQMSLGPTLVPKYMNTVRNYLVHPGAKTRARYEELQEKLGMLQVEPEYLLRQQQSPGLSVFTSWVRELQSVARASTQ